MKIGYANTKLQKVCTKRGNAAKHLPGDISPDRLFQRIDELAAFDRLSQIPIQEPPLHFHSLRANLAGKYAVTLRSLWRIVFEPDGDFEVREDGTAVENTVTEITILTVKDYHSQ